jgi:hypothetical protein
MMPLHDWIGEQRRLLTRFEQWWQETIRSVPCGSRFRWTRRIGPRSSPSSASGKGRVPKASRRRKRKPLCDALSHE